MLIRVVVLFEQAMDTNTNVRWQETTRDGLGVVPRTSNRIASTKLTTAKTIDSANESQKSRRRRKVSPQDSLAPGRWPIGTRT